MKQRVVLKKMHCTKEERISGMTTCHIALPLLQPSIMAASFKLWSTLMKPAT